MTFSPPLTSLDPPTDPPDLLNRLVLRSREGDVDAFDALVEQYYGVIFGLAFRMLSAREPAEDATQEIFLKAWRNLNRFNGASGFSTWLHTITVNHCIDVARRHAREAKHIAPLFEDDRDESSAALELPAPKEDWDRDLTLQESIGKLSEKLRVVVTLHYFGGYTAKEISAALNLPITTVYSRLHLALARLGRALRPLEGTR